MFVGCETIVQESLFCHGGMTYSVSRAFSAAAAWLSLWQGSMFLASALTGVLIAGPFIWINKQYLMWLANPNSVLF